MILAAFGDSFLYGSDLSDCPNNYTPGGGLHPSNLTWPALLAKHFQVEYQCYAMPGSGNQRILNDILNCVHNYGNSVIYIVNWTWMDRFDYFNKEFEYELDKWHTTRPSLDNHNIDTAYYKYLHSEELDKTMSLGHVYQAISALQSNNCKFVMTYMDGLLLDTVYHVPDNIKFLQHQVKKYLLDFEGRTFLDWAKHNHYSISSGLHPLDLAHKKAAEYWLPTVSQLLNTNSKEDYLHAFI